MKRILGTISGIVILFAFPQFVLAGNPPVQGNSQYTTPSNEAPADGSSTESFSIHLQDANNQPVVGDTIFASSSNDNTATFPQNNQTTDGSGNASFTVATTTAGTVQISVNDSTNNVTFTNWLSVIFYSATAGCQNTPPAPTLSTVVSSANNQATLTWVDSSDPVNNYLVSYGTVSGNYIYGDPNIGGQGTTSFTVGALAGGKKYYFAVAATNNCGRSGLSNEVSTIIQPVPSTPAPTGQPTITPDSSTPAPVVAAVDNSSSTPIPTDLPAITSQTDNSGINTTFRNLGIGIVAAGIILVAGVFIFQKIKNKNRIPQMSGGIPPSQSTTLMPQNIRTDSPNQNQSEGKPETPTNVFPPPQDSSPQRF